LAEDNDELRGVMSLWLEECFGVVSVATAAEAIGYISRAEGIDALVTDFDFGEELNGHDIARALRARFSDALIVLATGSPGGNPDVQRLLALRRTVMVEKPFVPEQVLQALTLL
jgi:CheY-like chemotaxis protein